MPLDGKIGSVKVGQKTIVTQDHPAVILTGRIIDGPDEAWPAGTILTRGGNNLLQPWDGETGQPAGVLPEAVNPAESGAALYLAHGTVVLTALKLADGAPGAEALLALARAGIYAI